MERVFKYLVFECYVYLQMNSLIATIRINMGLGQLDPKIEIYPQTDILAQIKGRLKYWKLPQKTQNIIFQQIKNQAKNQKVSIQQAQISEKNKNEDQENTNSTSKLSEKGNSKIQQYNLISNGKKQNSQLYTPIQRLKNFQTPKPLTKKSENSKMGNKSNRLAKCIQAVLQLKRLRKKTTIITFQEILQLKKIYKLLKGQSGENELKLQDLKEEMAEYKHFECIEKILGLKKGEEIKNEEDFIRLVTRGDKEKQVEELPQLREK